MKRSRTAHGVAAQRALLTEMGVLDDPYARPMLGPSMGALYAVVRRRPQVMPTLPVTLAGFGARVLWHDARIAAALDAGIRQVAIVGAGYDSRAWRMARDGVRFFELDDGATRRTRSPGRLGLGPPTWRPTCATGRRPTRWWTAASSRRSRRCTCSRA